MAVLGLVMIGLAARLHVRKALWRLKADGSGVMLSMESASGRVFKHESVGFEEVTEIVSVEGDDDIAPGVRLRTDRGPRLFVPARYFDVRALWVYVAAR